MSDSDNLPPVDGEMTEISERLQDYNKQIQEQAFLLGYRNGFREGELVQNLLKWVKKQQAYGDISQARRDVLRDVEHYLVDNGAYLDDPTEAEITYPPGMLWYLGAFDATPMIQVAGERIEIEDLQFDWKPNPHAESVDDFEPHRDTAEIELTFEVNIPKDSEERAELLEFLDGLR